VATSRPPCDFQIDQSVPSINICHLPSRQFQVLSSTAIVHHSICLSESLSFIFFYISHFRSYPYSDPEDTNLIMPAKHATRDRSWGTRYDTLNMPSPPSSPSTQRPEPSSASPISHSSSSPKVQDDSLAGPMPTPTKPEKTSHDSSIFIGRLVYTVHDMVHTYPVP
jgi:hypothetical protein